MAKVLLVDDAAIMRRILKDILENNGFEVIGEAENGRKGVESYLQLKPDLVTMDITMPDMDGINAVKAIRELDPDARVIMCSAMGQKGLVMEAICAGARDFIIKPFQVDRVLEAVVKALG